MGQYSIKDVESLSGVKAHTLRIWEQRYDFLKPNRTGTNIRFYDDEQLKLILNISTLNRQGMRISKIAGMDKEAMNKEVERVSDTSTAPNTHLDTMIHSMLEFDEARFEKSLSCAVLKYGFERTFTEIIFPLMVRTGVLWATGTVTPVQEHFISNLVRRKICAAIDGQYVTQTDKTRRIVMFLPEGETHELVLLFSEYLMRKANHHVVYLGNSVPFNEVGFVERAFKPDYLLTYFTITPPEMDVQQYINKLSASFPKQTIIVGGRQIDEKKPILPTNVVYVSGADQLITLVK